MSAHFEPAERCKTACKLLGNQMLIASGDPTSEFPTWDTFDQLTGARTGVAFQLTKAAFEAVGLVEGCDYRFASTQYGKVVTGSQQLPGDAVESNYISAATTWAPTATRARNFTFTIPFSRDRVQGQLYVAGNASCPPLNMDPVKVGIISGFALSGADLANSGLTGTIELVVLPDADPATVLAAFQNGDIDVLFYFANTPIVDDQMQNILTTCGQAFNTTIFQFGVLINNRGACADFIFQTFNEGLRRIVFNGKYSTIIQPAVNASQITEPWTAANFPNLKSPSNQYDQDLSLRLGVSPDTFINNPQNRYNLIDCNCKEIKHQAVKDNVGHVNPICPCPRKKHSKHHKKHHDDSDDCGDC